MGRVTTPQMVADVCAAGGFGIMPTVGLSPEAVRDAIRTIKSRTNAPFGVNVILAPPEPFDGNVSKARAVLNRFRQQLGLPADERSQIKLPPSTLQQVVEVALQEKVRVLSTALGDPAPLVQAAHEGGALMMAMVTTVEEARRCSGADIIVAQGAEAGGHRSTFQVSHLLEPPLVGTLALVPQIVDAVRVPVIAAGGIADGRGAAAALALGAAGAMIGTRFLMARESAAPPTYRSRLLAADETQTMVTRLFTGRWARSLRNRFLNEYGKESAEVLPWPYQAFAAEDIYRASAGRDAEYFPLLAGQALRLLKKEQSTREVFDEVLKEMHANLKYLGTLTQG